MEALWLVVAVVGWVLWHLLTAKPKRKAPGASQRPARQAAPERPDKPPRVLGVGRPRKPTYRITYVDAYGERTTREIFPYKVGRTDRGFEAWCTLRADRRNFVYVRIESAVDLATGEMLDANAFHACLRPGKPFPD